MRIIHNIKSGDTLQSVAIKYNCTIEELANVNGLDSRSLVGVLQHSDNGVQSSNLMQLKSLIIPDNKLDFAVIKNSDKEVLVEVTKDNITALIKNNEIIAKPNQENIKVGDKVIIGSKKLYHTIRPLETLKSVATLYGVTVRQIIENNNLKTETVFIGQKLKIE